MTFKVPDKHLPVHCCCDPTKRLGWVPVDQPFRCRPIRFCTERASYSLMSPGLGARAREELASLRPMRHNPAKFIETEIAKFFDPSVHIDGLDGAYI